MPSMTKPIPHLPVLLVESQSAGRVVSRRSLLLGLLIGVPASALFLFLALRGLDRTALWSTVSHANLALVIAASLAMAVLYALQSERWRLIIRPEGDVGRLKCLSYVVGCVAVNNVVPGRPGDLFRTYWVSNSLGIPKARALATVVLDRICDVLALVLLLALSVPFVNHPSWLTSLMLGGLAAGILCVLGLWAAWWYSTRSSRGLARGEDLVLGRSRLRQQVSNLVRGAANLLTWRSLIAPALLTLGVWASFGVGAWLVGQSIGLSLGPLEIIFSLAVLNLGAAIPSSPGFIGTYQWLSVAALGLFSIDRGDAVAFAILVQAVWYVPTTVAGTLVLASIGRRKRKSRP